jgi:hypothetical protein
MTLQRIVLTFKPGELVVHTLYRTQVGPGPNAKARTKEVRELTRTSLEDALVVLKGG